MNSQTKWMIALVGCGLVVLLIGITLWENYRLRVKVRSEWGKLPLTNKKDKVESLQETFEIMRRVFPKKALIDQHTWYDLDMWAVFEMLNATKSSIGSEYLYTRLHQYNFGEKSNESLAVLVEKLRKNNQIREKLQYHLAKIGKKDHNLVWGYLDNPDRYRFALTFLYPVLSVLPLLFLLLIPFALIGVIGFFAAVSINILISIKLKGNLEKELQSMSYLVNGITQARKIARLPLPVQAELEKAVGKVAAISKVGFAFRLNTGTDTEIFLQYLNMIFLLPIISYHFVLKRLKKERTAARDLWLLLGEIDAAAAVLNFKNLMPYTCRPLFHTDLAVEAQEMYHPLLAHPIANPVDWKHNTLVTGSNASGKSTYVKSVAINCLLAQTIGISCSKTLLLPHSHLYSSMALEDDIFEGESYFVAEIKSLTRILDIARTEENVLCFIDEILKGTNTIERISASVQFVKFLSGYQVLAFVATHDIELPEILTDYCHNIHFTEQVSKQGGITFDYVMRRGVSQSKNAIQLLEAFGYPAEMVTDARETAEQFEKTRCWSKLSKE